MTDSDMQSKLAAPFAGGEVRWKPGAVKGNRALAMPYIDARAVMDRLDLALGVAGWQDAYEPLADGTVLCRLRCLIDGAWIEKADVGGASAQPDAGDRMKAAFSEALKRAAVKFGVGRYLYGLAPVWRDYDPQRKQFLDPAPGPPPKAQTSAPAARSNGRAAAPGPTTPLPRPAGGPAPGAPAPKARPMAEAQAARIDALLKSLNLSKAQLGRVARELFGLADWQAMTETEAAQVIVRLEKKGRSDTVTR